MNGLKIIGKKGRTDGKENAFEPHHAAAETSGITPKYADPDLRRRVRLRQLLPFGQCQTWLCAERENAMDKELFQDAIAENIMRTTTADEHLTVAEINRRAADIAKEYEEYWREVILVEVDA